MPIYEYECGSCGRYEELQRITDPVLTHCRTCKLPIRKLVSQSSFTLKGGGWYKDLYGSPSSGGKANGKPAEAGKAEAKAAGKAEPKAEGSKAEAKAEGSKSESKSESSKTEGKASASSASDAKSAGAKKAESKSAAA